MKKKLLILFIISLFLVLPNKVNAQDYTYNICKSGCEWNETNFGELHQEILYASYDDENDGTYDNKYYLNFANGDYDFTNSNDYFSYDNWTYNLYWNFGEGTYIFDIIRPEPSINITGKGINKTLIKTKRRPNNNYSSIESFSAEDITIQDVSIETEYIYIGFYSNNKTSLNFKNVNIKLDEDMRIENNYDIGSFNFDNVTISSEKSSLVIQHPESQQSINITNCNFTNTLLYLESSNEYTNFNISNSNLNNVYVYKYIILNLDCNNTFNTPLNKGHGNEWIDIFENSEYNLYSYYYENDEGNSTIITEICKDKILKIDKPITLKEIKDEYGYDIDDSWIFVPEEIVELKDNKLVPLKLGRTKLSKEIDDEILTLRIEVVSNENNNNNNNSIINPKTSAQTGILLLIISILTTIILIKRKISIN